MSRFSDKPVHALSLFAALCLGLLMSGLHCAGRDEPAAVAAGEKRAAHSDEPDRGAETELIERLTRLVQKREGEIAGLLRRMESLEREVGALRARGETSARIAANAVSGAPASAQTATAPDALARTEDAASPARTGGDETGAQAALDRFLVKKSGLLLTPWTSELEPSVSYIHSSSDKVSIEGAILEPVFVVGDIISHTIRRDIVVSSLAWRLGLPHDFQADVYVPYRYEHEITVRGDNTEQSREGAGLGDMEVGLSRQLTREQGAVPDILGHLRWKTKTGSSPYSAKTSEPAMGNGFHSFLLMGTAVKVLDPAAFYGSLSYALNLADNKRQGRIDPGDTWGFNVGMALALNLETSFNLGWEQRFSGHSTLNKEKIPGSALRIGTLRIGVTHALTQDVALDASVGIGLTQDSPDVHALVAVPVRFAAF